MLFIPYHLLLSISGLGWCKLMVEIGYPTVKRVVWREGGWSGVVVYQRLIISCYKITEEQVCQNGRTGPFTDYGGINPTAIGRLQAILPDEHKYHLSDWSFMMLPFGLAGAFCCHHAVEGNVSYLVWRS